MKYIALILCLLGWGTWGVLEKKLLNASGNIYLNTAVFQVFSAIIMSPIYVILNKTSGNNEGFILNYKVVLIMLGVIATNAIASFFCSYLIKVGESTSIAITLTSLYPVVTIILSYLFLGEVLTIKQLIGIGIILIGFIITGV